jgi:HNH endonuclease
MIDRLPFAKPERLVSDAALAHYHAKHPKCEVCGRPACPQPHHLVPRARGRDDSPENLLSLCLDHHLEWHTAGPRTWWMRHLMELGMDANQKVRRAIRETKEIEDARACPDCGQPMTCAQCAGGAAS